MELSLACLIDRKSAVAANLKLDDSMTVGQATLPEGAKIVSGADEIAVQCLKPKEEDEEGAAEAGAEGSVEPELIRKEKPAEDEEEKE